MMIKFIKCKFSLWQLEIYDCFINCISILYYFAFILVMRKYIKSHACFSKMGVSRADLASCQTFQPLPILPVGSISEILCPPIITPPIFFRWLLKCSAKSFKLVQNNCIVGVEKTGRPPIVVRTCSGSSVTKSWVCLGRQFAIVYNDNCSRIPSPLGEMSSGDCWQPNQSGVACMALCSPVSFLHPGWRDDLSILDKLLIPPVALNLICV